jgi:hypothetical protein
MGNPYYDEDKNGGLFLNECATWLNARTFNDKNRTGALDFGVHGRKLGCDMWFLCRDAGHINKQVREGLIEYIVRCIKLDKMKIPVIGGFLLGITGGK